MFKRDQTWIGTLSPAGCHCSAAGQRRFWAALRDATERHQQRKENDRESSAVKPEGPGWDPYDVWRNRIRKDDAGGAEETTADAVGQVAG